MTLTKRNNADSVTVYNKEIGLPGSVFDGITLAMFTRAHVNMHKSHTLWVFIEDRIGNVDLNLKGEAGKLEIDGIDEKMATFFVDGELHVKGIAGVTGPFKGWFSRDHQRVPLLAEMEVFIGIPSVRRC